MDRDYLLGFPTVRLFGTKGHCPGTKRQWDKLKILPRDRTACQSPGRDVGRDGSDFDSLSRPVPRQDAGQKKKRSKKITNFEKKEKF